MKIKVCVDGHDSVFTVDHEGPVFDVMVFVDGGEDGMVHVAVFRASRDVSKIKFDSFAVTRGPGHHARPIAGIAVMGELQFVAIQIDGGDRIVGPFARLHLMQKQVPHRGDAEDHLGWQIAVHVGLGADPPLRALPRSQPGF